MSYTFAAISDNREIIQYPMTVEEINALNNPLYDYYPCQYDIEPDYDPMIQKVLEIPVIINNYVYIRYKVAKKTFDDAYNELGFYIMTEMALGNTVTYESIPQEVVFSLITICKRDVQELLDNFAKTRGYDDIRSACSYAGSSNAQFALEANRCMYLRDMTWYSLHAYLLDVQTRPFPNTFSWAELASNLPALTWE